MKRDQGLHDWFTAVPEGPAAAVHQRTALAIAVSFVWLIAWYQDTWVDMAAIWWASDTFSHGLVVLPVFAWLVWRQRQALDGLQLRPTPWLAAPAALAAALWAGGALVSVAAISHVALIALVVISLVAVLGPAIGRVLAFPLLFLFFAAPIGDFMVPILVRYTADFTVAALRLSGVPVYQEGTHFIVPNGRWSVVEACSGVRYLIASLMIGSLYAWLNYTSLKRRALFMLAALAVPIVANWVRAYLIVMLGYLSDNRLAAGVDHLIYGWVFFGVVIGLLFWIGGRWRETPKPAPAPSASHSAAPSPSLRQWLGLVPLAVVVAAFPAMLRTLEMPVADFTVPLALPAPAPGWERAAEEAGPAFRPHYRGHRAESVAVYRDGDGGEVALYVAYFAEQRPGREMVMWGNQLLPPASSAWTILPGGVATTPEGRLRRVTVTDGRQRIALWHWYRVNGRRVDDDYQAKAWLALDRVLGRADDSAFVAVMARDDDSGRAARERIGRFLESHGAALDAALAGAEERRR